MRSAGLFLAILVLGMVRSAAAQSEILLNVGDAYIARNEASDRWTIGNSNVSFTVGFDNTHTFRVFGLRHRRMADDLGVAWVADTTIGVAGRQLALGSPTAGFTFDAHRLTALPDGVRLDLSFVLRDPRLRVTRSYVCYRRAPVVEAWTTFDALSVGTVLEGLNAWQLTVPAAEIHTVTGLLADDADNHNPGLARQFTKQVRTLESSGAMTFGAVGRSSEQTVPWFTAEGPDATFFGGLMWSGAWTLDIEPTGASMRMTLGVPDTITTVSLARGVETPHGFFGVTPTAGVEVSLAMQSFIVNGLRGGRPLVPLVTFNTWFAYGTNVDEQAMRQSADILSRLGVELFVLDAGWYQGSGRRGPGDFESGLGGWRSDPAKFPNGLRPLAEHVESLGMRFGLWVEPERAAMENVGRGGLDERWLAMRDGRYVPGVSNPAAAQLCLGDPRVRQWVLERLVQLIDEVQPAYLKWDNNFWVNCNRSGHGHGTHDGNFAHVNGLYQLLEDLRERYPDLLVENVSGGGNRLDFGMVQRTDTGWMDDRTAPSVVVRHNLEGLGDVFPPAYLLSFALDGPGEPMQGDASDLPLYFRSRMFGAMGLTFRTETLGEDDEAYFVNEILAYKGFSNTLARGAGVLLSEQAHAITGPSWDAFQVVTAFGDAVVYAYQFDSATDRVTLYPKGLWPFFRYEVISVDSGVVGSAMGSVLMRDGIEVPASPVSSAQVFVLRPVPRRP